MMGFKRYSKSISHYQKYHKYCFYMCIIYFSLGTYNGPKRTGNNAYAKFSRANKEHYGIFDSGLLYFTGSGMKILPTCSSFLAFLVSEKS